ncbi:small subunit processome component 20 homolog isoform X1 [Clupea harengus]|uniref:Small subunit processome component 20 homolog isoform X1 n=1 Tax=Clupea harengus TaxID=7950 RepID=A0A6P8GG98_CLUHA|nr:small subunit processome component 20 homolog isoform X1 [Clupea harengus]
MKLKIKPTSHKSENTYRFLTFSERLANVNIDVIHRIDRIESYNEEVETYFYEALNKWRDLNLTDHFTTFLKEVSNKSQSFNLLVFHQKAIVDSLKTHLSIKNSMAFQPLLDLVVQLARDLQADFYPHFPEFFVIITAILETPETEVLEWVFTCLSYLYKYLWRLMVKDMNMIYSMYSKLLAHKKEHIRNFAAESFSFLMRKVPDFEALFTVMFSDLGEQSHKAAGVGQLIFEMCKGVRSMFHSCASVALPVALRKLGSSGEKGGVTLPWDDVKEALDHMTESAANHVEKEHFLVLWDALEGCVKEVVPRLQGPGSDEASQHIERLLLLYHTLVQHRKGEKVTKPAAVCETLLLLVQTKGLSYSCCQRLLQVLASLLLGENVSLSPPLIQDAVKKVFRSGMDRDLILTLSKELFKMNQFEQLVLPSMLVYLEVLFGAGDQVGRQQAQELLVRLILEKAKPPTDGSMSFEKYPLFFTGQAQGSELPEGDQKDGKVSVPQYILSLIDLPPDLPLTDLSLPWAALVLLPHMRPVESASVVPILAALLNRLLTDVQAGELGRAGLYVARQALSTLLSFRESAEVLSVVPVELVRTIIQKYPSDLSALLLGDLYYTRLSVNGCSNHLSHDALLELYHILKSNFSSNSSKIRLLSLRIMSHFEAELTKSAEAEEATDRQTVFAICLQAEQVPATVQDYREKLLHLRKLRHDLVQPCLPHGSFHEVPLRYLIAMLFINFKPLWDAVIDLLVSHAKGMDNKEFWSVFYLHLEMVAKLAEQELQDSDDQEDDDEDEGDEGGGGDDDEDGDGEGGCDEGMEEEEQGPDLGRDVTGSGDVGVLFLKQLDEEEEIGDRTDFTNFRNLLWKAMSQFPDRVEPRSRELTPLLLRFIRKEFFPSDLLVAPTQNLLKASSSSAEGDTGEEEEEEEEEEEAASKGRRKTPRRAAAKQLLAHLKVFSKFTNPRALYLEPSLIQLYTKLLCHKDQYIQKMALECVLTYKDPAILPYKVNLERLLDDKHFKDEIVHFNISEEGAVVQDDHRPQLIPLLMRILYGRMSTKGGSKFQGKTSTASRSSIVLRFLAGCQPQELGIFIDMLLEPVSHHSQGDCAEAVKRVIQQTDLGAVLPVGRQHSLLNVMEVLLDKLGHLLDTHLPKLLQILLCVSAGVSRLLEHREQLKPGCIAPLKNLRRLGALRVQDFFNSFDAYNFTANEIDAIFLAVVWPQVCRLPSESPYAPTPLLKLIHIWSKNARFFPLLGKQKPGHPECCVLLNVFALLSVKNASPKTIAMVMDIAESLLTTEDFVTMDTENEAEKEVELCVNDCVVPDLGGATDITADSVSMGSRLLFPHVPAVLQYLGKMVQNSERLKKKKFRAQVCKELNILSKISRFVTDREQSSTLITLLLPYLTKPKTGQDTELDILETVQNLLKQCSNPAEFLKPLSRLLSILHSKVSRQALCAVFETLAELDGTLKYITDMTVQLNAFDSRHLDEIYFDVRLLAFQEATRRVKEMSSLDMRYLHTLMHTCFHSFEIGDMSLADSAILCLSAVIEQLAAVGSPEQEYREIVQQNILDAMRKGLRSKAESARNDYTTVLACLVRSFPERPEFRDLVQLTDYNDPESDFFEHMKHIQVYRRARALRRIAKQLMEGTVVMSSRSMQNYIMPYAMTALFDEKMKRNDNMSTAGVEVVGAVCKRLTWSKYMYYLKQFVHILQTGLAEQKLAVNLLLTVLEAFHFDRETLSKEIEAAKTRKQEVAAEEEVDEEEADEAESEDSDGEDAVESHSTDATQTEGDAVAMETEDSANRPDSQQKEAGSKKRATPTVCTGLPRSVQDLEALIGTVNHTVTQSVLPRLHKCLTAKVQRDDEHKAVKSKEVKEEEVARVPIAFAMVRLMQTLPQDVMETNLPGVLLKVCYHLRSRFQEIRDVARNTLVKIIQALGAHYLQYLLKEMNSVLTKGYQVHVLTFTVYQLLSALRSSLKGGDLDPCLDLLVEICNSELFGPVAEEKDIKGISSKLMEARHSKSSDSYELLAQFTSQKKVTQVIVPLKEILEKTMSLKVSRRVHMVLRRVIAGLLQNEVMTPQSILMLSHGLVNESLPLLTLRNKQKPLPPPDPRLPPPSCLLLPQTPKRGFQKAAINTKTNMHILVETGLSMLHLSLKSSKVNSSVSDVKEMLDPFVSLLLDCLSSRHVKVITEALQAFIWVLKFPLPAVEEGALQLTRQLFLLLKDYARAGAAGGENFQLVQNCFKAITILVKSVTKHQITDTQLQVLLGYAEEDIYDHTRQATAFGLLKAILSRKLVVPEMEEVMKKVAKLAVTGASDQVRVPCRQIYLKYLMDYPLGKKLKKHLDFIVAQLSYEYDTGRQSALEMMAYIFQNFPQNLLLEHCGLFFVPLSLAVVNDDSARCKKMIALAIKSLLSQVDATHQNNMFALVTTWITGDKVSLRRLGVQVCGLFVEVEGERFTKRLEALLPLIEKEIHKDNFEDIEEEQDEKAADRLLFGYLTLITKLIKDCGFLQLTKPKDTLTSIWGHLHAHLRHPHSWVWLTTAQVFGQLFAAHKPEELLEQWSLSQEDSTSSPAMPVATTFLYSSLDKKMRELVLSFSHQLQSKFLDPTTGDQVVKNLLFVAKVIYLISPESDVMETNKTAENGVTQTEEGTEEEAMKAEDEAMKAEEEEEDEEEGKQAEEEEEENQDDADDDQDDNRLPSLLWVMKKLCLLAKREAAYTPKVPLKRTCVFKFLGAMAVDLGKDRLAPYLTTIIAPLHRELDSTYADQDPTLKNLAQELIELLKKLVGLEQFSLAFAAVQKDASKRRALRKRHKAMQAVSNPDIAARKKIKKHQKMEVKKRKMEFPRKGPKAKKLKPKGKSARDLAILQ